MTDGLVERAIALRDEAYKKVVFTPEYVAFKALDDAVAAMGGRRHPVLQSSPGNIAAILGTTVGGIAPRAYGGIAPAPVPRRRISQSDAAEQILRAKGRPLVITELLMRLPAAGAIVGGENAQVNFGSTLSRDPRFYSFRYNGLYYWWLSDEQLPEDFRNEATDLPLGQDGSGASSSLSNQEGGDGDAPATT
jgi:hypothetical protein